ncbi:MFS transporter [Rhodococcus sp. T2V]|nr:MFS transporter [Rhodococcus sp. T2V]
MYSGPEQHKEVDELDSTRTSLRLDHRPEKHHGLMLTLAMLTTITGIVSSLGAPLIPAIADRYEVELTDAQWALTSTLLVAAATTPVVGRLGAGTLRRPTILAGLVMVSLGTVLSAVAPNFTVLVIGRALQGVGIALTPLALAVARDVLRGRRVSSTIALLSVCSVAGAGLGYPVTGIIAQAAGLSAAYWTGAVLCLATFVLAVPLIPASPTTARIPVDWAGAVILAIGSSAALLAISQGESWGWASIRTVGLGILGVAGVLIWCAWTLRRHYPLVDLRLAIQPGVAAPNLVAVGAGVGMYTLLPLSIVLVQSSDPTWGLDQSISVAGLLILPYSVTSIAGSRVALAIGARAGFGLVLPLGVAALTCSTLGLAFCHSSLVWVVAWMTVAGLGGGLTFSSLPVLIVPHVPAHETGSALAFNLVLRYLGFSAGSAVGVTLMSVYGGGEHGFVWTLITISVVLAVVGVCTSLLSLRR